MRDICVTGAAQGLGEAIARRLIGDGYRVLAVDLQAERLSALQSEFGSRIQCFTVDVSDYAAVERFMRGVDSDYLCGLVNNAGIYLAKGIQDYSEGDVSRVLDVNLKGAIYFSKLFGECLLNRKQRGSILNISSSSIDGGSDPVYSASKAGLIGLTKSCALKFSPHIRVNAIAPGIVDTELATTIPESVIELYRARELVKVPLAPEDVASTASFLMSEAGRNYSGAVFDLNNGFHM
jgi:3-oxoacyl-[acyl-carrier protein] reductase